MNSWKYALSLLVWLIPERFTEISFIYCSERAVIKYEAMIPAAFIAKMPISGQVMGPTE
jgi:hypothetical protein